MQSSFPAGNVAVIAEQDRMLAALTHLSGLAGYLIPLGGVIVPIVIWIVKSEHRTIAAIARQAVLLNFIIFVAIIASAILWVTLILIPVVILFWIFLALVAIVLPIVGAVRALDGVFYRYPVVGSFPD